MSGETLELRAGPVRLELDGPDLRGLEIDGGPVVQRIYPAFRDAEWGTAPVLVGDRRVDRGPRSFTVALEGTARLGELDVGWQAQASGEEDGTVSYAVEVEARGSFHSRRLGLCVHLDAAACAGGRALAKSPRREAIWTLGDLISPQPLHGEEYLPIAGPFTALTVTLTDGSTVTLRTGETPFELEDQRNWADSSFKAYSVDPAPMLRCAQGHRLRQEVRLRLTPRRLRGPAAGRSDVLTLGSPSGGVVPPVGLTVSDGSSPPAGVRPAHLRVDVGLGEVAPAVAHRLGGLLARTGATLELAVHGTAADPPTLPSACTSPPLARVLALDRSEASTPLELALLVRQAVGHDCAIAVGTAAHFSEVCRQPPQAGKARLLCWSAHPQVHATDDRSIIENLPGLGAQVRTARALLPNLRPLLSPLRLSPAGSPDPRGSAAFGAAWGVGAFAQLLGAGIHAVTVSGDPGEEAVVAVAAALMAARGAPLRPVGGVDSGLAALAWGEQDIGLLLANLGPTERSVTATFPGRGPVMVSALGPEAGEGVWRELPSPQRRAPLRLGPYEALRLAAPR